MKKHTIVFIILIVLLATIISCSKNSSFEPPVTEKESVYFPKNLDECFTELKKNLYEEELAKFKNTEEDKAVTNAHFGLGMWIRNEWIRNRPKEAQRPLKKYFNDMGIFHPDDMSSIVLTSFHRHLNNKGIKLEHQVKWYQEYWEKEKEKNH